MRIKILFILFSIFFILGGCSSQISNSDNNLSGNKIKLVSKTINKTVGAAEFKKLINNGKYKVIDLRTLEELKYFGYISGMNYHFDFYKTGDVKKLLNLPKDGKYLIYCYHGNRSAVIRKYMIQHGFKYVIDLSGGINGWVKAGNKLVPFK